MIAILSLLALVTGALAQETGVSFDPCYMWRQIPASTRIAFLVSVLLFLFLAIQTVRRRRVRWMAPAALLLSLTVYLHNEWWFISGCVSAASIGLPALTVALAGYHLIRRKSDPPNSPSRSHSIPPSPSPTE